MKRKEGEEMRVLSLFDGISCGMIALEKANVNVEKYDAYEIDENAIKISNHNYPSINHKGNVFDAKYNEGEYDLLIGGSPCTYWSIAKVKGREITSSGLGWDLFSQYVRALKEAKPKYFLYENNNSMHKDIKEAITNCLHVEPVMIDSALLSAQSRRRLYWTNIPIEPILDKHIKLSDVVDFSKHEFRPLGNWVWTKWGDKQKIEMLKDVNSIKSHCLTTRKNHSFAYYLNADHTLYCNLTVNDFEHLQTIPTNYVNAVDVCEGAKYKAIGNGWTVDVIAHIFKNLKG